MRALVDAAAGATGYPATIGSEAYRAAAAGWIERRFGCAVTPDEVVACIGTKELVASLPRALSLRDPSRDTVLFPAASYPTYAMGATLAGLARGAGAGRRRVAPRPRRGRPGRRRARARCSGSTTRATRPASPRRPTRCARRSRGRASAGIIVASDECYAEFTYDDAGAPTAPVTALFAGNDGVLAVHSLSKRSNMAGLRAGFVAGDRELVTYLGEVRKHGGLMTPAPVQAAAAAALGDDEHVREQQARYARRRAMAVPALEARGPRPRRRAVDLLPVAAHRRRPERRLGDHRRPRQDRAAGRAGRLLRERGRVARPARAHAHRRRARAGVRAAHRPAT